MSSKIRISPSMYKDYLNFKSGNLCGIIFDKRWINRDDSVKEDPTAPMMLGNRFEYELTGALQRDGSIPPEVITSRGQLSADMKRLKNNVEIAKKIFENEKVVILDTQTELFKDYGFYSLKRFTDVYCMIDGIESVIDIKTTGMLEYGGFGNPKYSWDKDVMSRSQFVNIEVAITKILFDETKGIKDIPYYFYIADRKSNKFAFRKVEMSNKVLRFYRQEIEDAAEHIDSIDSFSSFKANPEEKRCSKCPLTLSCEHKNNGSKIGSVIENVTSTITNTIE